MKWLKIFIKKRRGKEYGEGTDVTCEWLDYFRIIVVVVSTTVGLILGIVGYQQGKANLFEFIFLVIICVGMFAASIWEAIYPALSDCGDP